MKRLWLGIRLAISIGLIGFLIYTVDFGNLAKNVSRADPFYLAAAFLAAIGDRFMMAYKWSFLLRAKGIRIPLLKLTGTYLITSFLGLFLPATIGGDAVRAYALAKEGHAGKDVISSIVVERLLGILALLVMVVASIVLSIFVFGQNFFQNIWNLFWILMAILAGLSLLVLLSLNRLLLRRLALWFERLRLPGSVSRVWIRLRDVYRSYVSYQDEKRTLGVFLLLSFVENLFPIIWTYYLARALAIDVPLLYFFILVPIVLVLVRLPISIDGIGIQEGAFVYFLLQIGVPRAEGLLLGIASHILAILSVLPGGVLYGLSGLSIPTKGQGYGPDLTGGEADARFDHKEKPV